MAEGSGFNADLIDAYISERGATFTSANAPEDVDDVSAPPAAAAAIPEVELSSTEALP